MRFDRDDQQRVIAITRELDTLQLGLRVGGIGDLLPQITSLIGLEGALVYSLHKYADRVELERWDADKLPEVFARLSKAALVTTPELLFYDFVRPERTQRNRAMEVTAMIDREAPGTWERSELCRTVFAPARMQHRKVLRVLVCEGPSLLGWFGGFQIEPVTARQKCLLAAFVPALRRRLSIERRLRMSARVCASLHSALEQLGSAAMVIDARGEVQELNRAAQGMIDGDLEGVRKAIRDSIAGRPSTINMEMVEIRDPGTPIHYLAIVRPDPETRRTFLVQAATQRWSLTKKQSEVLGCIVKGLANATIANMMKVGERAIELHVSAIFDRVGVESRSALVARVLA